MKELLYRICLNKFCLFLGFGFGTMTFLACLVWVVYTMKADVKITYYTATSIEDKPSALKAQQAGNAQTVESPILADIGGGVHRPGLYVLPPEAVLADLVAKAGGFRDDVIDIYLIGKRLNLAQSLVSGGKYYIPFVGESWDDAGSDVSSSISLTPGSTEGLVGSNVSSNCNGVSVNNADLKTLQTLSGVGEVRAASIIEKRPYTALDDLVTSGALTQSLYDKLKNELCL